MMQKMGKAYALSWTKHTRQLTPHRNLGKTQVPWFLNVNYARMEATRSGTRITDRLNNRMTNLWLYCMHDSLLSRHRKSLTSPKYGQIGVRNSCQESVFRKRLFLLILLSFPQLHSGFVHSDPPLPGLTLDKGRNRLHDQEKLGSKMSWLTGHPTRTDLRQRLAWKMGSRKLP